MKVKTCQQIAGVPASTETEVDDSYGDWLVTYGYATKVEEKKSSGGRRRKEAAESDEQPAAS